MFDWLKRAKNNDGLPEYSAIRQTPNRGLPAELQAREASEDFRARRSAIELRHREDSRRPREDEPLFTALVARNQNGMLTMALPDGTQCLPVFGSPHRAFDYTHTLLAKGPATSYLSSTPIQLASMLGKLREMGIGHFALDRCPRCSVAVTIDSASIRGADDLITCWILSRAADLARIELYLDYAREAALSGTRMVAREVAFETVAHVGFEDPRPHYLLGQVAVALDDRELLKEAKAFLRYLKHDSWVPRLEEIERSDAPDFQVPAIEI